MANNGYGWMDWSLDPSKNRHRKREAATAVATARAAQQGTDALGVALNTDRNLCTLIQVQVDTLNAVRQQNALLTDIAGMLWRAEQRATGQ